MPVSDGYREFVFDRLNEVTPITSRRMFGEIGVYARGLFFAIVADDNLYFKVDEQTKGRFEAAGMSAYNPIGQPMRYYSVPLSVLEDDEELAEWVHAALAVAERASAPKPPRSRAPRRNPPAEG